MLHEARLWSKGENNSALCRLCAHSCTVRPGHFGICGVRTNIDGTLYTTVYGNPIALHIDPIEKKPLYHFLPGTRTLSLATIGCNFRCLFCQNWQISQTRAASARAPDQEETPAFLPQQLVQTAIAERCPSISYTYTEPTVFFEYAFDTAEIAKQHNIKNVFVTNGFMSAEAIDTIAPYLDAANVDLKSFTDDFYRRQCKARLEPVLASIRNLVAKGVWVEVTTLIIPGENDSAEELRNIAKFLVSVSPNIPWHVTRFHPDYRFLDHSATPRATIEHAREIGMSEGLAHVHIGNI